MNKPLSRFEMAKAVAVADNLVQKFNPTVGAVHIDGPLTNISVAYLQSSTSFIASRVFPEIGVSKQSDLYFEYDRGDFNRNTMQQRAPATESAGDGYRLSEAPYYCPVYALHKDIPDQVRANEDTPLSSNRDTTQFLTMKAMIFKEAMWANKHFVAGNWSTDLTGVAATPTAGQFLQWSDPTSTPIKDIKDAKRNQMGMTGFEPNTLVLGRDVYDALTIHPEIVDRIKYGQTPGAPAIVTTQALAALFEVGRILVMNAIQNTANEGQDAVHAFIGGSNALLCYVAPTPGLMVPSAGYTFNWNYAPGLSSGVSVNSMRMDPIKSDRLEIEYSFDTKMVGADLGTMFLDAIA